MLAENLRVRGKSESATLILTTKTLLIENEKRVFYILNPQPSPYLDRERLCPRQTLIQNTSEHGYTDYCYKSMPFKKEHTLHFTSKISAFQPATGDPIEIKTLVDQGSYNLNPFLAYNYAIQYYLADVTELLVGFYTDTDMLLKLFSWNDLKETAGQNRSLNVDSAITRMENSINEIIDFVEDQGERLNGKIVEITKNDKQGFWQNLTFKICE